MSDWKDVVATVAPTLATALGGPMAGLALGAIASVFGLSDSTQERIAEAIASAKPSDLATLKLADLDFKKQMASLQIDLEKIASQDRDSARNREVQVKDRVPATLACLITLGFFGTLGYMMTNAVPSEGRDALLVMLGALGTSFTAVIAYYFGSSASSRAKDTTIASIAQQP